MTKDKLKERRIVALFKNKLICDCDYDFVPDDVLEIHKKHVLKHEKEEKKRIVKLMKDCMNLDEFVELQENLERMSENEK